MAYPEDFDDIVLEGLQDFLAHSASTQVALCLHQLESEVNNGGFHQFFATPQANSCHKQFMPWARSVQRERKRY
jgi:hypothetical protein